MEYLTQKELRAMMLLSQERIERDKEQINKINVFPVPDQDTGTNVAKTLFGIKEALEAKECQNLVELSETILEGALTAAQGNAGVIYTGFLAGFLPALNKNPVDAKSLAVAFGKGAERARASIQNPREGTVLDVIDATCRTFKDLAEKEKDIIKIFKSAIEKANLALLATREKMEIFRKANVVDAGGLAYLMILESHLEALEGVSPVKTAGREPKRASEKVRKFIQTISNRYEVMALIEAPEFNEKSLQDKIKNLGDSLDIVKFGSKIKLHIHTDFPDEVKLFIQKAGRIENLRIEDMTKEVTGEESVRKVSAGLVTENVAALSPKAIERYQIEVVSTKLDWPELEKFPGENIYQKMRQIEKAGMKTFPKVSQANPRAYSEAFGKQLQKFEKVLAITVSAKLSGCYNSALGARKAAKEPQKIFVLDSQNAAAGQSLLILRAIELIQEQRETEEIISELKNSIPRIYLCAVIEDPKWLESIGRITKNQANWLRRMKKLNIYPLITIKRGLVKTGGVVLAKDICGALANKIIKESKRVRLRGRKIRVVINHADNLEGANSLKVLLKKEPGVEVSFISEGPAIICAAAGPGTLIAAWTII